MAYKSLQEIIALGDQMRDILSEFIIENPNLTRKELGKQMDLHVQTLSQYLIKKRDLQASSAIKIYNFLHRLRKI